MFSPSLYSELLTQYLEHKYSVFPFVNKTQKLKNKNEYLSKGGEKQDIVRLEALRENSIKELKEDQCGWVLGRGR